MKSVMYALIARTATQDVEAFQAYERAVLPLLDDHGGVLDRRVRSLEGTCEIHLLVFDSVQAFDDFRRDPRRLAAQHLLADACPEFELIQVAAVDATA